VQERAKQEMLTDLERREREGHGRDAVMRPLNSKSG
jgi:hypothetical protein